MHRHPSPAPRRRSLLVRAMGRAIRRALATPAAWAILDDDPATAGGTWSQGGCYLLAAALRRALGQGELWMVTSPRRGPGDRAEHVVLRVAPDVFLDADGVSTRRALLARMARRERVPEPTLVPFFPGAAADLEAVAPATVASLSDLLARELGLPRPNGAPVAVAAAPRWPRAFVTVLSDGMSDSYGVLVFVGRSSMGRRRAEGASEAFAVARAAADDLLRRRVAGEVRLSFAVERRETRIEIRRLAPDGSVVVAPWHEPPRMNPSSETGHDQPHPSGGVPVSGAPPAAVRAAFSEGLRLYARGLGGAGLRPETVAWARRIARGEQPTPEKIIKMRAWFARHGASPTEVAARRRQQADLSRGELRGKAPALVAWLLWGGDAGAAWVSGTRRNPAKLDRCVRSVELSGQSSGMPLQSARRRAYGICTAALQRSGYLEPGTRTPTIGRRRRPRSKD